jgi:hypothetical protein
MTERAQRVPLVHRLAVALAAGVVVLGISCYVAYHEYLDSAISYGPRATLVDVGRVAAAIEDYRRGKHALPKALDELPSVNVRSNADGQYIDWWRRPLQYRVVGDRYRVASLGRDGKPGGTGLDYDLSSDDLGATGGAQSGARQLPRQARPTFAQFMRDQGESPRYHGSGSMMFAAGILTGIAAFLLGLGEVYTATPAQGGLRSRLSRLIVTLLGALLIAVMYVIPLHLPSGH